MAPVFAVTVKVEVLPVDVGENAALVWFGSPDALNDTLGDPLTVTVAVPLEFREMESTVGLTDTVKSGFTVTLRSTECDNTPDVPVTVTV